MNKAWSTFAALPLLACWLQAASPVVSEIPLPEKIYPGLETLLQSASQQSPRMINQALYLEIAENDRIAARANLLPSISAGASLFKSRETIEYINNTVTTGGVPQNVTKTPYSLSLSQPLFYWGERRNSDRMGKIQQQISQGQYRLAYVLLAQEIRTSYLFLIVSKSNLTRAKLYQQFARDQLKISEERYSKKIISDAQIADARLVAERADIGLERSIFDFENGKASIGRLAGVPKLSDEAIPDQFPKLEYPERQCDQLLANFLDQSDVPTIEAANMRYNIDIGNLSYANAKTRLKPKLNAVLGLSRDEQNNLYGPGTKYTTASRYAGVSVNWIIFDGFAARAATKNALLRLRQSENGYAEFKEQAAIKAQSQRKLIYFSARNMSIEDRALDAGEGNFRNKQEEFKRGDISDADLSQIRLTLYDIQATTYRARVDLLLKVTDFLGSINEDPVLALLPANK